MKTGFLFLVAWMTVTTSILAQPPAAPSCPTQSIYAQTGSTISASALPNGPPVTVLNNLPAGAGGLAIGPAFGFPAPNPTWWTTSGGTYWYYNNSGNWANTGHAVTNAAALNLGGGATRLYNLVGASGNIYVYNGTGADVLLTTINPAFGGGGPYDVQCDFADNFYILRGTNPQGLFCYNPSGVLTCSWSMTGMLQQMGGGFCILPTGTPSIHRVYYNSNGTDYIGDMIPGNSVIASTVQPLPNGADYASCALNIPMASINAPQGGSLTCNFPQATLVAQALGNNAPGWTGGYNTPTTSPVSPTCGSITWAGPGIVNGQGTPTITVNQAGLYSYTLVGCGSCPNFSLSASFSVTGSGGIITPVITAPGCFTGPSTMSVSPNNPTNTVVWTGPGIVGPNNTFTINFNAPGIYSVVISSGTTCSGSASVIVNPSPTVTISGPNFVCAGNSITLSAGGANTYSWSNGSLTSSTAVSPTASTVYSVTGTSTAGCSNTATVQVTVGTSPTLNISGNTPVCQGQTVNLVASGANSYLWNNGSFSASIVVGPSVTTGYTATGFGQSGCTGSAAVVVMVNALPSITVTGAGTICAGISATLNASGANTYTWSFGPNSSSVVVTPSASTVYSVSGTSTAGCIGNSAVTVSVVVCTEIAAQQIAAFQCGVFPNPVSSELNIESNVTISDVRVFDVSGRTVYEHKAIGNGAIISMENFEPGLYLLRVRSAGAERTFRIIKKE